MQHQPSSILQSIYVDHLKEINGVYLTRREIELISFFISGRTTKKIAFFFGISPKTVENHTHNIMVKLNCNSREAIIDFVEKSDKINALRNYYSLILSQEKYESVLCEAIESLISSIQSYTIKYNYDSSFQNKLTSFLDKDLKRAGLKPYNKNPDWVIDLTRLTSDCLEVTCVVKGRKEAVKVTVDNKLLSLSDPKAYYLFVFHLLTCLSQDKKISELDSDLKGQLEASCKTADYSVHKQPDSINTNTFSRRLPSFMKPVFAVFTVFVAVGVGYEFFFNNTFSQLFSQNGYKENTSSIVRTDLDVPQKSALLEHKKLFSEIQNKLSHNEGVQTLALIGIGGAGKTTVARRYAQSQLTSVISEINAQSNESIYDSFVKLAKALTQTEDDEKKLGNILELKLLKDREDKLAQFVKQHLARRDNWLLIYDDVDKFSDIQKYFPIDSHNWGKGRIIITTQDSNIVNNRHVNSVIRVDELTMDEKLDLFLKIMESDSSVPAPTADMQELKQFIAEIPPFPLDVSVAAYYIKATNISYKDYLQNMLRYNKDFSHIQEEILQQAGDYTKTRYGIINLSLDELTDIHESFKDLLLFISLLDFQNISRYLLTRVKDPSTVDNFIYRLKQYSLIQNDASDHYQKEPKYSIHRSTQSVALAYMTNKLNLQKNKAALRPLIKALISSMAESIDNEDFSRMRDLYRHAEQVLTHDTLLEKQLMGVLSGELGCIYYYLCDYTKAEKLLNTSISLLRADKHKNNSKIARYQVFLGSVHKRLGNYEQAKHLFDQSLALYNMVPDTQIGKAKASGYLGVVYETLGDYRKAKSLLEESKKIYEQFPDNEIGVAWSLTHLGSVYRRLGEYQNAKELYKTSYSIYKAFSKDYVGAAWACVGLGDVYMELGNLKKAKEMFDESLAIYNKHFVDEHIYIARALVYLGIYYRKIGDYKKARDLITKSLSSYRETYGNNHSETGWVLLNLGMVDAKAGDDAKAEALLLEALNIFQTNKCPNERIAYEELSSLYAKKSVREKENAYLLKALESAEHFLPPGSHHIERIRSKIKKAE